MTKVWGMRNTSSTHLVAQPWARRGDQRRLAFADPEPAQIGIGPNVRFVHEEVLACYHDIGLVAH